MFHHLYSLISSKLDPRRGHRVARPAEGAAQVPAKPRPHVSARGRGGEVPGLKAVGGRRRETRYRAAEQRVWVEWWSDGEFNGLSGQLLNISRGGAMVVIGASLGDEQRLMLLIEDVAGVWVEAVVRAATPSRGGVYQTRLEFLDPCPPEFLEAAACGFEAWLGGGRRP